MEGAVYVLCALTALSCSLLLARGYRRTRVRLLLWCCLFFAALTLENALLFVDLVVVPEVNLLLVRRSAALLGVTVLLYGLVFEAR